MSVSKFSLHAETRKETSPTEICVLQRTKPDVFQISDVGGETLRLNPYPTAFPYGNGIVLHFYQQQESSRTKTVHRVINKGLKTYV